MGLAAIESQYQVYIGSLDLCMSFVILVRLDHVSAMALKKYINKG